MTQDELKELLHYNDRSGEFRWIRPPGRRLKPGDKAGSTRGEGYVQIVIHGRAYQAHRLAWMWMTGEWPEAQVDHRNGSRSDNRWSNLRPASNAENQWNAGVRGDNSSGVRGVRFNKARKKWVAQLSVAGKNKHLGLFDTLEEASEAVQAKRRELHGEFAR